MRSVREPVAVGSCLRLQLPLEPRAGRSSSRVDRGPVETDNSLIQMLGDAAPRRVGAAELIASTIRTQILAGKLQPGEPLPEVQVAAAFGVARNTVREGLKILARSGLAVHELHRGV